ncbi:histidine kinase [Streptomyces sp. 2A115]|uniref:histidine kinase n=1 Tax=Streptomyces sp. 2A115 TaxID=3457439 RepID=UPI003FD2B073
MPDTDSVRVSVRAHRLRPEMRHLPHLAFFLTVGGAISRLIQLNSPLCWFLASFSALLAMTYAGGLIFEDRLSSGVVRAWPAVLILLWTLLTFYAPQQLTGVYGWSAVPLACVALRALGRRSAVAAVAVITGLLVAALLYKTSPVSPEAVVAPVAAVWATVALYWAQQREAAVRQRLVDELRGTRDALARRQREAGVQAERARIARDLHDTLAQELSGSLMLLQAAERDWDRRPEAARTQVRAVAETLGANLTETRQIIGDLTPLDLAEEGLESALHVLCVRAQAAGTAPHVRFRIVGEPPPPLPEDTAVALLRVAQGALANVREHAHATQVVVTLRGDADQVVLEVRDDGRGFEPGKTRPGSGRGFGLSAARARLRECAGTFEVSSSPGRGTRVRAGVAARPVARPAADLATVAGG